MLQDKVNQCQNSDMGEGGVKNVQKNPTSFIWTAPIVDRPEGRLVNSINVHCSSLRSKIGDAKTFASCNFYDVLNAKLLWHLIATDNDALTQ